jgi:hypothetical protein
VSNDSKHGGGPTNVGTVIGPIWFAGWLFTIGFIKLSFWKAVLGLIIWPYFLGLALRWSG